MSYDKLQEGDLLLIKTTPFDYNHLAMVGEVTDTYFKVIHCTPSNNQDLSGCFFEIYAKDKGVKSYSVYRPSSSFYFDESTGKEILITDEMIKIMGKNAVNRAFMFLSTYKSEYNFCSLVTRSFSGCMVEKNVIKDIIKSYSKIYDDETLHSFFCSEFVYILWQLVIYEYFIFKNTDDDTSIDITYLYLPVNPTNCWPNSIKTFENWETISNIKVAFN